MVRTDGGEAELLAATSGEQTVITTAFRIGWPDAPHRVLASALAAAKAFDGDIVGQANNPDGHVVIARFQVSTPSRNVTGHVEAMALYAGTGVGSVNAVQRAADVVADLVSLLGPRPESAPRSRSPTTRATKTQPSSPA